MLQAWPTAADWSPSPARGAWASPGCSRTSARALATDHDVVHVALSGHQAGDAQDLASALAVTTGVPLAADDSVASLVRALQTSDVVVLVDEAEWVLGPAAELARAILAGCPVSGSW